MTNGFPINKDQVRMIAGLWYVVLPNDKHPESKLLPNGYIVYNVPSTDVEAAEKHLKEINEWARQRGGRPKEKPAPKPEDYLKF